MWRDAEMINKTYDAVEQVETQGRRSIAVEKEREWERAVNKGECK